MSIRGIFTRKGEERIITKMFGNKIICDNSQLKKHVTSWAENEGWKFEDFADFLELIGAKAPIKLSDFDEESKKFKCVTALDTEFEVFLRFGDWMDFCSEISVSDGKEERIYEISSNHKNGESIPRVNLQSRIIKKDGKELSCYYSKHFCHRTLKFNDEFKLIVNMDEPNKYEEKPKVLVLQNCIKVEEYMISLEAPINATEVYTEIMKLLEFTEEDIANSESIAISYTKTIDREIQILSRVIMSKGKMKEYATIESGETFHVFEDGSWEYLSEGIKITYIAKKKQHIFSMVGAEEIIINSNPKELLNRVKEKISTLWGFVKE